MTELIYNGTVKFTADHKAEHSYIVSKLVDKDKKLWTTPTPVVGVTTITGIIAKPALIGWSAKLAAEYMRDNVTEIGQLVRRAEEAKRAHIVASTAGKAAGSVGHNLVEALLQNEPFAMPSEKTALKAATSIRKAFLAWQADHPLKVVEVEKPAYSLAHNFAGKFDLLAEIDGKLVLIDFKTTNTSRYNPDGIYAENFAQLGAYLILIEEQMGVLVDEAVIVNLPKDGADYKTRSLVDLGVTKAEAKSYFLNAKGLYDLHQTVGFKLSKGG